MAATQTTSQLHMLMLSVRAMTWDLMRFSSEVWSSAPAARAMRERQACSRGMRPRRVSLERRLETKGPVRIPAEM